MKFKRIYSTALAGAMALGVLLGSGIPAYAAPEDWFKFDVDREGKQQPSFIPEGTWNPEWAMSYGSTIHPGYYYAVRIPYDGYGYKDDGAGDGFSYFDADYYEAPDRGDVCLGDAAWSKEGIEKLFQDYPDYAIPAGKEILIRTDVQTAAGTSDQAAQALAAGYMLVYDKNSNLVDSFPLLSQAADNTAPVNPVATAPAETTVVPETTEIPVETETATIAANPAGSDAVMAVAKEVLRGKWSVGAERRIRLEQAGYDYKEVQKKVYELMK